MHTTILGTCDVCDKRDAEISRCIVHGIETFACEECLDIEPKKIDFEQPGIGLA